MPENINLLEEIYQTTKMGLEATRLAVPKVHSKPLRGDMLRQAKNYLEINRRAKSMLRDEGCLPEEKGTLKRAMVKGSIRMNTLLDNSSNHIAEMMIQGTNMGIINITKKLNRLNDSDAGAKNLAQDYLADEQRNIETMKKYL
ncbi:MAG: hypothetical protein GX424_01330 [Clostridiales bacterium]|jgi:hypothetical protein|nr:hypothetical protein [Clostridiales bacterium]